MFVNIFFFETLGIAQTNKVVLKCFEEKEKSENIHWQKHSNEFNESIENFIVEKFNPQLSHYKYTVHPNRKYISDEYEMSAIKLYKLFAEHKNFEPRVKNYIPPIQLKGLNESMCNFDYFRNFVKKTLKISFNSISSDKCNRCVEHKFHLNECSNLSDCDSCIEFNKHQISFNTAREIMNEDKNSLELESEKRVFACYAQKIFSVPALDTGNSYFMSRLNTLNQTFCELGSNPESFCFLSNDTQIEKKSKDFIKFFMKFIKI